MNARENISLPSLEELAAWTFVRSAEEKQIAQQYFDLLRVKAAGIDAPALSLSGGNQQKLVLARWLASKANILLIDEPTRGVDIGAKAEIHHLIDQLARQGAAILLISSELPEILNLSTRILVLRHGQIAGHLTRREADQPTLLRLMAGISPENTNNHLK
jgi:ABC-type sugar transport system ATPase subunit